MHACEQDPHGCSGPDEDPHGCSGPDEDHMGSKQIHFILFLLISI